MQRPLGLAPFVVVGALLCSCRSTSWHERVDMYGSMHAVMHDGRTEGRIGLADLPRDPLRVGLGALEGLQGEIVIEGGRTWISRAEQNGRVSVDDGPGLDARATLLAFTHVERWTELEVERDVPLAEFDAWLATQARRAGLVPELTYPFVIEGELADLDAHVLRGRCPYSGPGAAATEPAGRRVSRVHGKLVGFSTRLEPGMLTHRGSGTHVHVLLENDPRFVGHVDGVTVLAGARLRLPARGR